MYECVPITMSMDKWHFVKNRWVWHVTSASIVSNNQVPIYERLYMYMYNGVVYVYLPRPAAIQLHVIIMSSGQCRPPNCLINYVRRVNCSSWNGQPTYCWCPQLSYLLWFKTPAKRSRRNRIENDFTVVIVWKFFFEGKEREECVTEVELKLARRQANWRKMDKKSNGMKTSRVGEQREHWLMNVCDVTDTNTIYKWME